MKIIFFSLIFITNLFSFSFEPDLNGLIMGMSEQDFNFAMAIYGIALSFLISLGFILSV